MKAMAVVLMVLLIWFSPLIIMFAFAPTHEHQFNVGDIVEVVIDGRTGIVRDVHKRDERIGVLVGSEKITTGLLGGKAKTTPYSIFYFKSYEIRKKQESEL
jgi:hypothetical protein